MGSWVERNLQGVFAGVTILYDDIEDLHVIKHVVGGTVGAGDRRVLTEGECTEDRGDDRSVVGDRVEPGTVGAIVHGIEDDFELDGHIRRRHGLDHEGDEVLVVSVGIGVNETFVSQWGR